MSVGDDGSVTEYIGSLKAGQRVDAATRALWERYFEGLVRLARARLAAAPRGRADEEDVALSVLDTVFQGLAGGRFPRLEDRDDLWKLLVTITARKASNLRRDEARMKRGGGRTLGEGSLAGDGSGAGSPLDRIEAVEPTPDDAEELLEQFDRLLGLLRDETLRRVAVMKLEGYLNAEIARALGTSLTTVERKLAVIRKRWEQEGLR
jgi:DNA-directed RNA polymerase specialized sigma24 family protein